MTKRKASVALDANNEGDQSITQESATNSNPINGTNSTAIRTGSSSAGSGASRNLGDNATGNSQKSKKERADNWSSAEIQVLHRGIESRKEIFYGPPSQATKKNRELAWDAIVKEVNSVSTTPRSLSQVMKKFKNEKCRAKRKFVDEKDGHNNISNNSNLNSNSANNNNMTAQNHSDNGQQLQSHHMTTNESTSSQPPSINVVKLAPQNVSKTMIDLPGHVHPIPMPGDDMLFFVPEMDGLIGGVNIVSDGNGHHHLQKSNNNSNLNNQPHSHHNQHTIQTINTGQGLVNGTMGNGMMARTIPAGSMCSLVYSTGSEVCGSDQHLANNVTGHNPISSNNINIGAQNLVHHRGSLEQNQGQQQQQHHQLHQHQHPATHQQHQAPHPPQQPHQPAQHVHQNQLTATTIGNNPIGGVAIESHLKNLLFNLLFKDGQNTTSVMNLNQDISKQRNDTLVMIASSLNKIEAHLSKLVSVASSIFAQNINNPPNVTGGMPSNSAPIGASSNNLDINNNDGNNNVSIPVTGSSGSISGQTGTEG